MLSKDAKRREFKKIRADIDKNQKKIFDKKICNNVIESNEVKSCDCLLLYFPIGDEIDTTLIFEYAKMRKIAIGYPKCNKSDRTMRFFAVNSFGEMKTGAYGICEPENCKVIELDSYKNTVCIVPCLSCDDFGTRLGYGAGYYDRFFAENKNNITKIALCYEECRKGILPKGEFDIAVDFLATQKDFIKTQTISLI